MTSVSSIVSTISTSIVNPILALLFALGVLIFLVGIVEFLLGLNRGDNTSQQTGKRHMLWGLVGLFVMVSTVSILHFIASIVCNGSNDTSGCAPPSTLNGSSPGGLNGASPGGLNGSSPGNGNTN